MTAYPKTTPAPLRGHPLSLIDLSGFEVFFLFCCVNLSVKLSNFSGQLSSEDGVGNSAQ